MYLVLACSRTAYARFAKYCACMSPFLLQVLSKYMRMIDGSERRLNLARKYKCHEVVVEARLSLLISFERHKFSFSNIPGWEGQ